MFRTMKVISVSLFVLLLSAMVYAQGGVATGDLHVTVKDSKGNGVTNATVTAQDVAKGLVRTATSDGQGGYSARLLPPGTYTVTVSAAGFTKVDNTGVSVTVGGLVELPVTLTVAGGKEVVEVTSQAELVETSRSSTTDTIGERRIDNLPINGRNYINFTLTDSQVVRDNAPNTGAAPTSGLNMSGQRGRSNLVNVDGADATDNSINGVRSTVSQEAVQEFQIITNNYAAEYGRAAGGVVNIITRSGSNDFHGDIFGYLRNRNFQAVNPFSTVANPAYTRVQAGAAFGGAIKKDKTYYYFAYEITRRHETGFSSIGQGNFGLTPFDTTLVGLPFGTVQLTPDQIGFLTSPAVLTQEGADPLGFGREVANYVVLTGASSGQAIQGAWPTALVQGATGGLLSAWAGFPTSCPPGSPCSPVPASYQTLTSQEGNFPVFEGTSIYSLRLDQNLGANHRLTFRGNVSPSTVTGIEVSGQDQPFGQNAYSRTSQQTYRDVAGMFQDTWTMGANKVNEFRFQYARRGLSYFYNTKIPSGSAPAVNITGYAYFGREPYSYIQRTEQRFQFTDNFSLTKGRHNTKFGADVNYLPINATFTVNYGGVYDFGTFGSSALGFACNPTTVPACPATVPAFPDLNAVQSYGAGLPGSYVQGLGSPSDSFHNIPFGAFWQDSWRISPTVTLNYGVRYDVEIPPKFKSPQGLALPAYNILGLQKGIQTDKNNLQPRIGVAWDPKGDGKTVVRASFGMFYDHPLLGLYFLGDASDGSSSGQLAFGPTSVCSTPGSPSNLNAITIFQGLPINVASAANPCAATLNPTTATNLGYLPNQQQFQSLNFPQSIFLNQNYLNPANFMPLGFQPFGYPQSKNFVYAYAQQANVTVERDLGHGLALSLAYNFNGGRHLNRPINANTIRGDLMVANFEGAVYDAAIINDPTVFPSPASPFTVSGCNKAGGPLGPFPFVDASLMNFFRPGGLNPSIIGGYASVGDPLGCITQAATQAAALGFNNCNPATFAGCVPFGDMDANYSNGSSIYHGFSANLRKRFAGHYEFLASYTWSHSIDDSTDLQSTLTPQDSYYPGVDRSTSLFDQRHRFVFSGVYQTGKLSGGGFVSKVFSDWTFAPLLDIASGRPFNILTGSGDNLQLSSLTSRPNTTVDPACSTVYKSRYSPTGTFQEPCINGFVATGMVPTLLQLDGNLGRNAGVTPWTAFGDLRVSKRIHFGERISTDLIVDMFNIANKYNVAAVSPLFTNAGQATAADEPRQFQFAMKVNW
ncbi:MAG TPA: carboxypeptidase regulatory-like domain-containing protein [Candidatus Dormibacteraeota bacterium]|nr:carboxypeptidase regulatory-like domain-containing protein [Candidatus Dormibacteraeota bacterium]